MKYLSMRLLIACLVVPIVLHILGAYAIEKYAHKKYSRELDSLYIGSTEPLFAGSQRLVDTIQRNIDAFLKKQTLVRLGLPVKVTVVTENGLLLYPPSFDAQSDLVDGQQPLAVARENYRLLNAGPTLKVDVLPAGNSPLLLGLLTFYVLAAVGTLAFNYHRGMRLVHERDQRVQGDLKRLEALERQASADLELLEKERRLLKDQLQERNRELETERQRINVAEDSMVEELVALEEKLQRNIDLQKDQNAQIAKLQSEIERYENAEAKPRRRRQKDSAMVLKRFKALYKNIVFHDRAAEGFADLTEELKIKAEEVIYQLNNDPDKVVVKRKVFGGKNSPTVFEVIFAYRGRLYFNRSAAQTIQVLAVGTKHSQDKDLAYLLKI